MAKIEITKTELVWPGKYNEDGTLKEVPRVSLPFQVIERVNESRATREARKGGVQQTLFDVWESKEDEIMAKRDGLIEKLERRMRQRTSVEPLFTIRRSVV